MIPCFAKGPLEPHQGLMGGPEPRYENHWPSILILVLHLSSPSFLSSKLKKEGDAQVERREK